MTITVISQTTEERKEEIKQLYQECKPYLDKGYRLSEAIKIVKKMDYAPYSQAWYKDLQRYIKEMG